MTDYRRQAAILGSQTAHAPPPTPVGPSYAAFESVTVSSTAVSLPMAKLGFDNALITVETDQVRFRLDAIAPTSSVGHLLDAGDTLILNSADQIVKIRFIRVTSDATLRVSYGK